MYNVHVLKSFFLNITKSLTWNPGYSNPSYTVTIRTSNKWNFLKVIEYLQQTLIF